MTRLLFTLGAVLAAASLDAPAQSRGEPNPATVAAMEHVKDMCTKDTPCKYRVEDRGPVSVVTVEFTRKESPDSPPRAYPGGRTQLTIDKKGNLVKRVDG